MEAKWHDLYAVSDWNIQNYSYILIIKTSI